MDQLAQPIGALMRPTFSVDLQDSLRQAARKLRDNGCDLLPVTENEILCGAIDQTGLAKALANGSDDNDPAQTIAHGTLTAGPATTGAEALRLFQQQSASALIVIDGAGHVLGVLTPSDLYPKVIQTPRPPMIGGMATPFGVYLTTGSLRGGAGHLALVATGMCMFGLFLVGQIAGMLVGDFGSRHGLAASAEPTVVVVVAVAVFLLGMRLVPLSGIHAAEHKVVHAIERGEELVPSIVRRMPRVHPRCGTNLAVGAAILTGIGGAELPFDLNAARIPIAAIATLILWRPLGNITQFFVTTKRPTERQLQMGIRAGKELLDKFAASNQARASIPLRIVNSGILHVIAGSFLATGILWLAGLAFHLPQAVDLSLW